MKITHGTALVALAAVGLAVAGVSVAADAALHAAPIVSAQPADPVSGDWDGEISAEQIPDPIPVTLSFKLEDGAKVTGGFTVMGNTADFEGEWDAENSTIIGVITDPDTGQEIDTELEVDGDSMNGTMTVEAGDMSLVLSISATRAK